MYTLIRINEVGVVGGNHSPIIFTFCNMSSRPNTSPLHSRPSCSLTGRIPGSRRQGRHRLGIMDNLCAWTGRGKIDLLRAMRDRQEWRAVFAEATGHGRWTNEVLRQNN